MNFPWAICLVREDAASLSSLRQAAGVDVAETGGELWLRGKPAEEAMDAVLSSIPATGRFELLQSNLLRRVDHRVPCGRLPDLNWQPLNTWLRIELPNAALPANEPRPVTLQLVRSTEERESELLETSLEDLRRFAEPAAQFRLARLQFAAAVSGRAIVRGKPLPPLPGRRYSLHAGVAVPAGFAWQPAVSAEVLARRFAVSADALVLWNEDGTVTRFHQEQFVSLSRSAVRATEQALMDSR